MHGRQILQGHFGKHYKLHFIQSGPVPRSLTPLRFVDSHSARRFLAQLHTPQSYWQWLTRDYHDAASFSGHQRDHLQVISDWVLQGRLRIYEVELPDSHALSRSVASLQDRQGYQFQFAPMKQALASPAPPQRFNSIQQVYETLYDLAPNLEQLQSVVADLQLIPAPEQQTYSQLMDALAEGLTEERVALYINAPFKRPEPAGAAAETAANMPGNRKVELAPATPNAQTAPNAKQNTTPSSLEDATKILAERRKQIAQDGYKQKYSDQQLKTMAEKGELNDRFFVRLIFGDVSKAENGTLGFKRDSGRAPYWATTFDMAEAADTDPEILAALFGIEDFDPKQPFTLAVIDMDKMPVQAERESFVPTFANMNNFGQRELGVEEWFDAAAMSQIMDADFSQEYAGFMEDFRLSGGNIYDADSVARHSQVFTNDVDLQHNLQLRHKVQMEFGANPLFSGNGLTKVNKESRYAEDVKQTYGVVETFTFERDPLTIEELQGVGAVKLLSAKPIKA
jgi:hypothetical protein